MPVVAHKTPRGLTRHCSLTLKMGAVSLLLLLLLGFGKSTQAFQNDPDQSSILAAYNAAIYDAAVYKFSNLRPLKPLEFDATKTVSVVTLTNSNYKLGKTELTGDVWVTAVPEVRDVCRGFSNDLEQRLRQLLGLHPSETFTNFVVMRVKKSDIFRPTADPDPTTTRPCPCPVPANCGEAFPARVNKAHVRWLANQMLNSYVISESYLIPVGYPWTRLGYTYNWRPGANKYGASEYVIRKGSTVTVTEKARYKEYCSPSS